MAKTQTVNVRDLFLEVTDNHAISRQGDYLIAYNIQYVPQYSQGEEDFLGVKSTWDMALKNLPVTTIVAKSDLYLKRAFSGSKMPQDTFLQRSTAKYFDGRLYFEHTGVVFFICPLTDTLKNKQLRNPFVFPKRTDFEKEEVKQGQFRTQVEQAVEILNRSGYLSLQPMEAEQMVSFAGLWMNGFNESFVTDTEFREEYIKSARNKIGMYLLNSERSFPETVKSSIEDVKISTHEDGIVFHQGFCDDFGLRLACNHVYNQIIFLDDTKHHEEALYSQERKLRGVQKFNPGNAKGAERTKQYIEELKQQDNVRFVRGHTNVIFFSEDDTEFRLFEKDIAAIFKEKGFEAYHPTGIQLINAYLNSLYLHVSCLDVDSTYLVDLSAATCLFINNSVYTSDKHGVYFQDRIFNIPIRFDWWDEGKKRLASRNFGIFAPTGRGKSVFLENLISGLIDTEENIAVIVDLGRSYERLAKLYPQEQVAYYHYELEQPLGLNPFELEESEKAPSALKIDAICELIWVIIKKESEPSEPEKTSLRKIVDAYYVEMLETDRRDDLSWQSFFQFVTGDGLLEDLDIAPEFFNLKEFVHIGSEYTAGGVYESVFKSDGRRMQFEGKKLIIFELDEIRDNHVLLAIMLQIIAVTIQKVIWKDKETRGTVLFEEFAKLLQFPGILARAAWYSQAIRKQEGAFGIVMQSVNQFPDNNLGRAIVDNMETVIVLPTDNEATLTALAKRCHLTSHDLVQCRSMRHKFQGERTYSEYFLKRNRYRRVFRLELAPEAKAAFFTDGPIAKRMRELEKEYPNMQEAIEKFVKTK